jgi:hypothetical protein
VSARVPDAARDIDVGVQPGRPARPQRQRAHVPAAELEPAADRARRGAAGGSPPADDRDHVLRIGPDQDRVVDRQQPADLLATAENTCSGGVARATSAATRRSADCSSAS